MTKQEILNILDQSGKGDLSIPEEKRLSIPKNGFIRPYLDTVEALAEKYRGTAIPQLPYSYFKMYHETGDRWYYEDSERGYFPRRGRLAAFGVLSWLYGRQEDMDELCDVIWAVCDEYTWSLPAHMKPEAFTSKLENDSYMVDLFASETGQSLAEIAFLLGDRLPEIIRRRIACLLEERIFSRVLNDTFWWMSADNNWAAVCAGSVGMAAIYAIEEDAHLAEVLEKMLPAFATFLSGFAEDGSCLEGLGYWNYGFSYFVSFADLLKRRTHGLMDLLADPRTEKIASFQQKCFFKGGRTVSFSDGGSRGSYYPGLTGYLCSRYGSVQMLPASLCCKDVNDDHCYRFSNILRNLIWSQENAPEEEMDYGCCLLPAAQWYLNSSADGVGLAFKGGNNSEPHNHNDVGSFLVYKNGEEILSDLGSGEYTRQYFSSERYGFLVCGSQGHSVPVIDGNTQIEGIHACARNVAMDESGMTMDIADAYGMEDMASLIRSIRFQRESGTITLRDIITFDRGEHEVRERFITRGSVDIREGQVVVTMNGESMILTYDPKIFTPAVTSTSYSAHMGIRQAVNIIDLTAQIHSAVTAEFTIKAV